MQPDVVTNSQMFTIAIGALGASILLLFSLVLFVWRTYVDRQNALEDEVGMLKSQIHDIGAASVSFADVKELLDDKFSGLKESHNRIEMSLRSLTDAVSVSTTKIALLEDREKRNEIQQTMHGGG